MLQLWFLESNKTTKPYSLHCVYNVNLQAESHD
jgi:hypothetical protein